MLNDSTLLSPIDVAKLLGVHRTTVYHRIHSGELPAVRLGEDGPYRVRSDDLEAWLAANPAVPEDKEHD